MPLCASPSAYDAATRQALVDALLPLGLDLLDLEAGAYQAHWAVRGPHTAALHTLFGGFADTLSEQADTLSEFVRMLGGQPMGTPQQVADGSRLEPYPVDAVSGQEHCKALFDRARALVANAQAVVIVANEQGAADALDLVTVLIRAVQKTAGFIGDHLVPEEDAEEGPESAKEPPSARTPAAPAASSKRKA